MKRNTETLSKNFLRSSDQAIMKVYTFNTTLIIFVCVHKYLYFLTLKTLKDLNQSTKIHNY